MTLDSVPLHQPSSLSYTPELTPGAECQNDHIFAVDAKEIVDRLREILKPAGIHVGYYPPPSNEELMTIPGGDVGGGV